MISFTDKRLYAKGTCSVLMSDVNTGDVWYQSDKAQSGNITANVNLNEIRAGLGNPIAAMIPSDSGLTVDYTMADFSLMMKAAQMGATHTYGAPSWTCQTVTASSSSLSISVSDGTPVAQIGQASPVCYVQEVGAASGVSSDGIAYPINATTGVISNFTATSGKQYKVWYHIQKVAAEVVSIGSLLDPKVARFEAQIAVYANESGAGTQGTRCGWLYVVIPCLKLQADATITGDQGTADTTKVSGQAIAYDASVVSATCTDCDASNLGYYIYVPDNQASNIKGLAIVGGVISVVKSTSVQTPVRVVMADGSLVVPSDTTTGFTYALSGTPTGTSVSTSGLISAGSTAGDGEITVTYAVGDSTYSTVANVSVTNS